MYFRKLSAMVKMMCGVKLSDRKSSMELMSRVVLSDIGKEVRLRWYGHVLRSEGAGIRRTLVFEVESVTGRFIHGWDREQVEKDGVKAGYGMLRQVTGVNGNMGYLGLTKSRQTTYPKIVYMLVYTLANRPLGMSITEVNLTTKSGNLLLLSAWP